MDTMFYQNESLNQKLSEHRRQTFKTNNDANYSASVSDLSVSAIVRIMFSLTCLMKIRATSSQLIY